MYEIRCIVADKRLHEVLKLLYPLALEPPVAIPVDLGEEEQSVANGHRKVGSSELVKEFLDKVIKSGAKTITARQLRDAMVAGGFPERAYGYQLKLLVEDRRLKKTREAGIYEVVR